MPAPTPVVFIHGLWIHSDSWNEWSELYRQAGYDPVAPGWPGEYDSVAATRQHAAAVANHGIEDITASYRRVIDGFTVKPVVVGHSFGGLIAQKLLAEQYASAAVAIDPAQIRGVKPVPPAQLRSGWPVLSRPGNRKKAVSLTREQFRYGFGNAVPQAESDELFDRWTIPGPGRPLFEASAANFSRNSPAAVDTRTHDRGPLLIIGGGQDHTVPESVAKAAYKLYAHSAATTDYQSFPDRGHSLVFDHGWHEIADATLAWLKRQGV
ncbi:alpha/beta hydrolase [Streptacidiphilus sp. N1-3]|uniref:Alpha/beta hydrolase n=1 Tax=Streptacidiphilus alkalitolerans TaxID=3342712 RepID=A0ABV6X725_9ACTN